MTRGWHIRDVYKQYREGHISFDDVLATAELGVAEYEQRQAERSDSARPSDPPVRHIPSTQMDS